MAFKSINSAFMRPLPDNHPWARIRHFFFGHPLKSSTQEKETLSFFMGLPLLAIDALSSVTYATEEILIALSVAGTGLYGLSVPVAIVIILLLATLILSYTQTVQAYPEGGGAYTIARNHLGTLASLVASSALLIDYTLTVAVSVSAGVRALTSTYSALLGYQIHLSVLGILFLIWINLRGLKESARLIAPFVYTFIFAMLIMGASHLLEKMGFMPSILLKGGQTFPDSSKASFLPTHILDFAMIPIILRAFAGGCTAMTGIEAVANAGSTLKRPHALNAQRILIALGTILGFMFLSITVIAYDLGLTPLKNESLLSQIVRSVWGGGVIHTCFQLLTTMILLMAANTAFAGAPKLSATLARDGWLPKQLYIIGDRLVFSKGIIILGVVASILVIIFKADTHYLIPLYAIGVFTAFTLSQAGMVVYWRTCPKNVPYKRTKMFINGFGALLTAVALLTTFEAKFKEGAFLVLIAIPLIITVCLWIHHHYCRTFLELELTPEMITSHVQNFSESEIHTAVLPVSQLNRSSFKALSFAREMTKDVHVVIVDLEKFNAKNTKARIEALGWDIKVKVLPSPYRSVIRPIIDYVHWVDRTCERPAIVILPEFVPFHWWESLLHNKTAQTLVDALSWSETIESQSRIIINVPYYLKHAL